MTEGLWEGSCDRGFVGGKLLQRACGREAVAEGL